MRRTDFGLAVQGDTWDFWPALAVTFWQDGFSVELSWLKWCLCYNWRRRGA